MKTIEIRALELLDLLKYTPAPNKAELIIRTLKEEQKLTRHACAESANYECMASRQCTRQITDKIHSVIMNTQIP